MTVRRSGSGAHRLLGLCALILMLACAVMGTAAVASAAATAAPGHDGGSPAATDRTPPSAAPAAPAAQQPEVRAADGDGAPRCSGSAHTPEPVLAPRHQPELTQPAAVATPAPALPAVPLADRAHPPAHGSHARPPDLAQLSVLRI
ncbi:hypothetical protein GCM10009716_18950 [Streptomyces sodiiphilus]|uniref:Uncharacterized protein n=1 Tax=Streptomyces sodiiphilus TaxID=226217 RepID=A0ABP5AD69_9ACTN